ncbi:MAG: hypothetical protein N7Q72_06075 [Spiroplasma sp. Tabriz.8]|nr:hypothetical protein [Spiroplasma sp. Tabriz.8]
MIREISETLWEREREREREIQSYYSLVGLIDILNWFDVNLWRLIEKKRERKKYSVIVRLQF